MCEKSDGVRVLFLLQTDPAGSQVVYLVCLYIAFLPELAKHSMQIDRRNIYYEVSGFWFPHPDKPRESLMDTILDGELVVDVNPSSRKVCSNFSTHTSDQLSLVGDTSLLGFRLSRIGQ